MSTTVGTVVIDVKADTAKLVSGMNKAEKTVKSSVDSIKKAIVGMAAAYVGIQGVKAFSGMISDSLDAADATGKLAQKLGLATDRLSEYQYAAGFAAVENGKLNAGLNSLIRRLKNFQETGGGAGKKGFEALGISAEYAKKNFKSTDDAFVDILKRLEEMPDGYKKTAAAQDIFSKSASDIMRITGTDLEKFSKEAQKIGISISQSTYEMAASYHDQMDQLDARMRGIKQTVAFSVVAPMNAASQTAVEMYDAMFGKPVEQMQYFEDAATTTIANVAYSVGFISDAFTGVELVLKTFELGVYSLGHAFVDGFTNVGIAAINSFRNGFVDLMDIIADSWFGKQMGFDNKMKDFADIEYLNVYGDAVAETTEEIMVLVDKIASGRGTADTFVENFKANLVQIKEEAQKATDSRQPTGSNGDTPRNTSDIDGQLKKQKAFFDLTATEVEKINALYLEQYNIFEGMFDEEQLETFFDKWNEELDKTTKNSKTKEKNSKKTTDSEIEGLEGIAGASADLFEQESSERKALEGIELGLAFAKEATMLVDSLSATSAVANSAVVTTAKMGEASANATASVTAAGTGDPYTSIGRVIAMIALMGAAMTMFGGTSGGGGSGNYSEGIIEIPDMSETYGNQQDQIEESYEPIINKFDRQIELLESIDNHTGDALSYSLDLSSVDYTKATKIALLEAAKLSGTTSGEVSYTDSQRYATDLKNRFGDYSDIVSATVHAYARLPTYATDKVTLTADTAGLSLNELFDFMEYLEDNNLMSLIGYTQAEYDLIVDGIQQTTHDFTMSIIDSMDVLTDFADNLSSTFDKLTQSDFYKNEALGIALNDVSNLIGDETLESYIQRQITSIRELESQLSDSDIALLLSTNMDDIVAQRELMANIQDETNIVLDSGVIDALNFQDSISLVGEAMVESTELFEDSLESLQGTSDSLQKTIDTLRNATVGESHQYEKYKQSMSLSQSLLASGNMDAFQAEVKKTQSLSSVLSKSSVFQDDPYGYEQAFAQSVAANQFETMQIDITREIDIMKEQRNLAIENNTLLKELIDIQNSSLGELQSIEEAS